jgi:NYN domain
MPRRRPRAIFYVDGFNLYNGLHRRAKAKGLNTPEHRWLNLSKLAEFLVPEADVIRVRYFTSLIKRRAEDPDAGTRQAVFLRALATLPNLTVHLGHFQRNLVWRRLVDNPEKSVRVIDFKEKGSDVNLAAFLIHDALGRECELACVISSDSDLVEPIRLANAALPRGVIVLSPNVGRPSRALDTVATGSRRIKDRAFRACYFPDELEDVDGVITKPPAW